jgi:hypothetical protein
MERVKSEVTEGKPKWKKVGGGSLRIGKKIIKPNEVFEAFPDEISPAFRNMVIPFSGDANFKTPARKIEEPTVKKEDITKLSYTIEPHGKSALWFDVVDAQGKVMNTKSLKKEFAEKLVEDLLK